MDVVEKLYKASSGCEEALAGLLHCAIVGKQWEAIKELKLITVEACNEQDAESKKYPLHAVLEHDLPLGELIEFDTLTSLTTSSLYGGAIEGLQPPDGTFDEWLQFVGLLDKKVVFERHDVTTVMNSQSELRGDKEKMIGLVGDTDLQLDNKGKARLWVMIYATTDGAE